MSTAISSQLASTQPRLPARRAADQSRASALPQLARAGAGAPLAGGRNGYELDRLDRAPPARGAKPVCNRNDLVTYGGGAVRYAAPATVHPAFAERLLRFERVVREVAIEIYGRAPRLLHHDGAYACRTSRCVIPT